MSNQVAIKHIYEVGSKWGEWEADGEVKQPFRHKQLPCVVKADLAIYGQVFSISG